MKVGKLCAIALLLGSAINTSSAAAPPEGKPPIPGQFLTCGFFTQDRATCLFTTMASCQFTLKDIRRDFLIIDACYEMFPGVYAFSYDPDS